MQTARLDTFLDLGRSGEETAAVWRRWVRLGPWSASVQAEMQTHLDLWRQGVRNSGPDPVWSLGVAVLNLDGSGVLEATPGPGPSGRTWAGRPLRVRPGPEWQRSVADQYVRGRWLPCLPETGVLWVEVGLPMRPSRLAREWVDFGGGQLDAVPLSGGILLCLDEEGGGEAGPWKLSVRDALGKVVPMKRARTLAGEALAEWAEKWHPQQRVRCAEGEVRF